MLIEGEFREIKHEISLKGSIPLGIEKIILELQKNEIYYVLNKTETGTYNVDELIPLILKERFQENLLTNLNFKEKEEILNLKVKKEKGFWNVFKRMFVGSKSKY